MKLANSYTTTSTPGYNPDYKKQYDAARQLVEGRYQQAENKLQEDYSAQQPAYTQQKNYIKVIEIIEVSQILLMTCLRRRRSSFVRIQNNLDLDKLLSIN